MINTATNRIKKKGIVALYRVMTQIIGGRTNGFENVAWKDQTPCFTSISRAVVKLERSL